MLPFARYVNEQGVAAANDERDVGFKLFEFGAGRCSGNPGRVEVRFVMMNADERFVR